MKQIGLNRCLEILELERTTSKEEVKQAYRDCVNVWHPDRFAHNPRLKAKAEKKLKEINEAYDTLMAFLSAQSGPEESGSPTGPARGDGGSDPLEKDDLQREDHTAGTVSDAVSSWTEVLAETSTRALLTASSRIMQVFRRWIDTSDP